MAGFRHGGGFLMQVSCANAGLELINTAVYEKHNMELEMALPLKRGENA
jgi:hypothetical protein